MSYINRLRASGMTCGDFDHKLQPLTLIVGPNFSGKTSRLNAIRLALMGHLPELGKRPSDTLQLASGTSLEVAVETSDGKKQGMTARKSGKKSDCDYFVEGLEGTPPVLLDPSTYFELGDKDRMRYVFGLADVEALGFGVERVLADLKAVKVKDHSEGHQKALDTLVEAVSQSDFERHEAGQPIQEWIEALIADQQGKLRDAKKEADTHQATASGITSLAAAEDIGFTADQEKALAGVQKELAEVQKEVGELFARRAQLAKNVARRDELAGKLKTPGPKEEWINAKTAEIEALSKLVDGYQSKGPVLSADLKAKNETLRVLKAKVNTAADKASAIQREMEAVLKDECCPFCKSIGSDWKKAFKESKNEEIQSAHTEMSVATGEIETLRPQIDIVIEALNESCKADNAHSENRSNLETLRTKLRLALAEREKSALWRGELGSLEKAIGTATLEHLDRLSADADRRTVEISGRHGELERKQRRFIQHQQDEARRAQALQLAQECREKADVTKAAVGVLEALQTEMVKRAFGDIIARANDITDGILKTPLEFRDGEIGRYDAGKWISHRTFSGCEKAVTYAAISVALAKDAPVKIVMIDELGRMDFENREKLLVRMDALIKAGKIDQFIGCATESEWQATRPDCAAICLSSFVVRPRGGQTVC